MNGKLKVEMHVGRFVIWRFNPMARLLRMGPKVAIDGKVVARTFKALELELPIGPHELEISIVPLYLPEIQRASLVIDIVTGQTIVAHYRMGNTRSPARLELGDGLPEARML